MENMNSSSIFVDRKDPNLSRAYDPSGAGFQTNATIMSSDTPIFEEGLDAFNALPPLYELFGDLSCLNYPSIYSDVVKFQTDNNSLFDVLDLDDRDIKPEIRNSDCMWSSGSTSMLSTSASSTLSDNVTIANAVPLAVVTGNTQNIINNTKTIPQTQQQQQPIIVLANNRKLHAVQHHVAIKQEIKTEPNDDYEQQLQQHSIRKTAQQQHQQKQQQQQQQQQTRNSSMQHIPPGTSLLRKSNTQQLRKLQQQLKSASDDSSSYAVQQRIRCLSIANVQNTNVTANNNNNNNTEMRPDTPYSINDDTTEFKHSVDLRACVMGSNNISLNDTEANVLIQQYKQELQDTSRREINTRHAQRDTSLSEVLDVIHQDRIFTKSSSSSVCLSSPPSPSATETNKSLPSTHLRTSECETDDDEDDIESSCSSAVSYGSVALSSQTSTSSGISSSSSMNSGHHHHNHHHHQFQQTYLTHHSDHSYTRCKDGMEEMRPNLETPSDSDEEIDVVSVGDKKFPTNPSDKDLLKIQSTVTHKLSNEHIVKTPNGIRTILPQRRASSISNVTYTLPYTPASNSPVKSVSSSRYPSPASTPKPAYKYTRGPPPLVMNTDGSTATAPSKIRLITSGDKRKRMANATDNALPTSKKVRGKKTTAKQVHNATMVTPVASTSIATTTLVSNDSQIMKRHYSLDDAAAETIEKRNLHNDMERQRRVGLKNLFDGLKKQIPSIKDKERAPKVNILREAAKLCHALTHEDDMLCEQKALLQEQLRKKQEILTVLRATLRV